jgi:hypothetical protein
MKGTRLIYKVIPILVLNILKVMGVLFLFMVSWGPSSNNLLISIWPTTQGTLSCTFQNIYHGWNVNNGKWVSFNEWNVSWMNFVHYKIQNIGINMVQMLSKLNDLNSIGNLWKMANKMASQGYCKLGWTESKKKNYTKVQFKDVFNIMSHCDTSIRVLFFKNLFHWKINTCKGHILV